MAKDHLAALENSTYLARFDDGLLDLFIGLSLLWIGGVWLGAEDVAALAGLLPAVLATPFATWRGRFLRDRSGHVRFSDTRREWERRNLAVFLGVGVAAAVVVLVLVARGPGWGRDAAQWFAPGLIALFTAVLLGLLAAVSRIPRLAWYTLLLLVGAVGAAALAANPGAPLVLAGAVITAGAVVLVRRYLRAHPAAGAA